MKARKTRLPVAMTAAVVSAVITARAESFTYEGRYLGSDGKPVVNTTKAATLKVYTGETTSTAAGSAQITIATDADGCFTTTADVTLSGADAVNTFWLGVTPEGGAEISPRMRVSPAPFAIRAASARVLEVDGDLRLDGTVTITTLTSASEMVANSVVTTKPMSFDNASLENIGILTIGELSNKDYKSVTSSLSMLRTGNGAVPNFKWDEFPAEVVFGTPWNENSIYSQTSEKVITVAEDGVALIMVRIRGKHNNSAYSVRTNCKYSATLSNGQTTFLNDDIIEECIANYVSTDFNHYYAWSVPVLRGKDLTIKLRTEPSEYFFANMEAKIQFVYFGAAK